MTKWVNGLEMGKNHPCDNFVSVVWKLECILFLWKRIEHEILGDSNPVLRAQ